MDKFKPKKEEKEKYEKDRELHITYINEQYQKHNLELIKKEDLKKLKRKKYFSGFMTGIFILIGLSLIAGSLFYASYYDKFKSEIICGNSSLKCETQSCINNCDKECPDCSCGDCNFPDNIEINLVNETT